MYEYVWCLKWRIYKIVLKIFCVTWTLCIWEYISKQTEPIILQSFYDEINKHFYSDLCFKLKVWFHWLLLLDRVGVAFIERSISLLILFMILHSLHEFCIFIFSGRIVKHWDILVAPFATVRKINDSKKNRQSQFLWMKSSFHQYGCGPILNCSKIARFLRCIV
jgi:hypothetical protein